MLGGKSDDQITMYRRQRAYRRDQTAVGGLREGPVIADAWTVEPASTLMGYVLTPVHVPTVIKTNAVRAAANKAILRMRITFLRLMSVDTVIQESDAAGERGASSRALPKNGHCAKKARSIAPRTAQIEGLRGFCTTRSPKQNGGRGAGGRRGPPLV